MRTLTMGNLALLLLLGGCTGKGGENGDTSGLDGETDDDGGGGWTPSDDTGDGVQPVNGKVTGTVRLQLYRETDGIREYIDWADVYDGYPLGTVFLAAYTEGPSGDLDYPGTTVITPDLVNLTDGNTYEIPVKMSGPGAVRVYAAVDYYNDGIMGTDEPQGIYPAEIELEGEEIFDSADITVLVPYTDFNGDAKGSGSADGSGGSGCSDLTISGDIHLDRPYDGGRVAVMLLGTAGDGPYEYTFTVLQADESEDSATGTYSLPACAHTGAMQLRGAWDSNSNNLIDPADLWGSYMNEDEEDGNPITIGSSDLSGYDVAIPLGGAGLSLIPFTEVQGDLTVDGGTFDDLPSTTSAIYIVALKYSPSQDMDIDYLYKRSYDVVEISPEQYAGRSSISFALGVPSDSVLYLWAYADNDGDGSVNGPGEYVGSGGGSGGRILTTEGVNDGNDIAIGVIGD